MTNFIDYKIGINNKLLQLESCEENRQLATIMVQQSRYTLEIISRLLDPMIFNTLEFTEAIRQMVTTNRQPKIRIIVFDPETIVRNGHRLVELAGSLSSFIEMRKAGREFHSYNECLLLADNTAYIHRNNTERFEATANFNDKRQSKFYLDDFEIMWASALPDPNLRRLSI
jgi:hypothetical protein